MQSGVSVLRGLMEGRTNRPVRDKGFGYGKVTAFTFATAMGKEWNPKANAARCSWSRSDHGVRSTRSLDDVTKITRILTVRVFDPMETV